jgi:Uncharacterized conserved protein (some members contain a von Willebrand factor type A (vWA) domain)
MVLAWGWLKKIYLPDSSFTAIAGVFITVTLWFLVSILFFGFVTAVVSWLLFLMDKKHGRIQFEIRTDARENNVEGKQDVFLSIHPVLKPLLGNIRLRIQYEDKVSDKFTLLDRELRIKLFSTNMRGYYQWPLPDIKEYNVSVCFIYFEDMFQFFSFTAVYKVADHFVVQPRQLPAPGFAVQPKKTEQVNTRIERIRKVEGEFLNYKNFEHNDDVRRIVWKIYAKNKELVIRIPETNDPSASHIYFYASFYNSLGSSTNPDFVNVFLNHFKTMVWNTYYQLSKKYPLLKYIPDQESTTMFSDDPAQKIKLLISMSGWHQQKNLQQYFKKEEGSVLCITSLVDASQLENVLQGLGKEVVVLFVKLSKIVIAKPSDWIEWVFIKPSKNNLLHLKPAWNVSPFKRKLIENEKNILSILHKGDCEIIIA